MKMHQKLLFSYLFVTILPVFITGYFFIHNTRSIISNYINYVSAATLKQAKINVVNKLNNFIKISDNMLVESQFIELLNREYTSDSEYLNTYVDNILFISKKLKMAVPETVHITVFTTNKTLVQDYNVIYYANSLVREKDWYKKAVLENGKNYISMPYYNDKGIRVFAISRLLYKDMIHDKILVLRIEVQMDEIYNLMREEGKSKKFYLIDRTNQIFASSDDVEADIQNKNSPEENGIYRVFDENGVYQKGNDVIILQENLSDYGYLNGWQLVEIVSSKLITTDLDRTVYLTIVRSLVIFGLTFLLIFIFSFKLTKRLRMLTKNMSRIKNNNKFEVFVDYEQNDEIGKLSRSFKEMIERIDNLISEVYVTKMKMKDLEIKKKESEINALQSQINPHFLFNTMETVSMNSLAYGDKETSEIVRSFARILRMSIEWDNDKISLSKELDLVLNYLKVQKFRYGEKLSYFINICEIDYDIQIPKFTIQPIVENSIYHGLELKEDNWILNLSAQREGSDLKVTVVDNGIGISEEHLERIKCAVEESDCSQSKSIGLKNIHQRLKLYYGEHYGISIESSLNIGTSITVTIPLSQ